MRYVFVANGQQEPFACTSRQSKNSKPLPRTLDAADDLGRGKTTGDTDTYHGRFVELVPDEKIVEAIEFETQDPSFAGEMTMTVTLADVNGSTR